MEPESPQSEVNPPSPASQSSGKRETLMASGILALCLMTAIGNWVYGVRPKKEHASQQASIGAALFEEQVDLGVIVVEGTIMHQAESGFNSKGAAADRIVAALRRAEQDGVKGLLIKINSPGGTAAASQSVYGEILRLRKEKKMRIVAAMGDMAASGGYYIASACDKIYANPATLTGSIGVIAQFTKLQGLFDKLGLETTVIKSGKFKDIGSPYRSTTPEERDLLQKLIDDTYMDFLKAVSAGRKLPIEQVRKLADGRIYTGNQALANKLVDSLGDYNTAMADLKKMTQLSASAQVKDYSKPGLEEVFGMLGTKIQSLSPMASLESLAYTELHSLNKVPLMLYN